MHRPPARRPRRVLTAIVTAAVSVLAGAAFAGCADDGPPAEVDPRDAVAVVPVAAQRCEQPNRAHGLGVVVGDGVVVTAGHVVEGDLRALEVDGRPATVRTLDRDSDLAVLAVPGLTAPVGVDGLLAPSPRPDAALVDTATLVRVDDTVPVQLSRREVLVVDNVSDHATYRRHVVVFEPGVVEGDSGAPLVAGDGRLVGIVILTRDREAFAVTAAEVSGLLAAAARDDAVGSPGQVGACP